MDARPRTSLSAGIIIREVLLQCELVTDITRTVFPVAADVEDVELPYIYYSRTSMGTQPVKVAAGNVRDRGSDFVMIEVNCCSRFYDESLALAEAVRMALDGEQARSGDLVMRSCQLVDSSEGWQDDAYIQQLIFNVKIS